MQLPTPIMAKSYENVAVLLRLPLANAAYFPTTDNYSPLTHVVGKSDPNKFSLKHGTWLNQFYQMLRNKYGWLGPLF